MKNGFAITGIIYTILLIFIMILVGILVLMGSRKAILDDIKMETLNKVTVKNTNLFFTNKDELLEYGNIDLTNGVVYTTFVDLSIIDSEILYSLFMVEDYSTFQILTSDLTSDVKDSSFPLLSATELVIRVTTKDLSKTKDYKYFAQ